MTATTSDSALTRLRLATANSHRELEHLVESLGLLRSAAGFARHLGLMYAHCASHEMLLSNYPALQTLVTTRRAELGNDLEVLGQALPAVASRAENCYNHAQCLGFTYVTEGSRLGAVVIARRVQSLGVSTDGLQSMQTSQAMVRARWSKYCEQLGELALTDWDFAAAAAVASFEELKQAHLGSGPVE